MPFFPLTALTLTAPLIILLVRSRLHGSRTINWLTLGAVKPFEIRFGPFDARIFELLLHRLGQIEISGSDAEGVNINCPLPIVAMNMGVSLTLNDGGYQSLDVSKKVIDLVMCRFGSVAEGSNLLLGIKSKAKGLNVVNIWTARWVFF